MADRRKAERDLFGGPYLPTCPSCGAAVVAAYCARCGDRHPEPANDAWFSIVVETSARRALGDTKRLSGYPGRVEERAGRFIIEVERASQIDWLRTHTPRILAAPNTALVTASGRRITPKDPVYPCLLGVMESGIRGCMTQKARAALCDGESALLPLREEMRTYSLSDQLYGNGQEALARELVLGVLCRLHDEGQKLYCPLFGRSLALAPSDAEALPFLLARLCAQRNQAPIVRPFLHLEIVRGQYEAARVRARERALHPRATGPYRSVVACGPGILGRYDTEVGQPMVDLVTGGPDGEIADRVVLQADDMDLHEGHLAVLRVDGGMVRIQDYGPEGSTGGLWAGGRLPATDWRVRRWTAGWYWVHSAQGALLLLGPERGWLLSPSSGEGRQHAGSPSASEFSGVIGLVRLGRHVAILSARGHRLTVLEAAGSRVPQGDPPLAAVFDAALPCGAMAIGEAGSDRLLLADDRFVFTLAPARLRVDVLARREPPERVLMLPGRALLSGGQTAPRQVGAPAARGAVPPWEQVREQARLAAERGLEGEALGILDRQGRLPHRSTWGG